MGRIARQRLLAVRGCKRLGRLPAESWDDVRDWAWAARLLRPIDCVASTWDRIVSALGAHMRPYSSDETEQGKKAQRALVSYGTHATLAAHARVSTRTLSRYLARLMDVGLVVRVVAATAPGIAPTYALAAFDAAAQQEAARERAAHATITDEAKPAPAQSFPQKRLAAPVIELRSVNPLTRARASGGQRLPDFAYTDQKSSTELKRWALRRAAKTKQEQLRLIERLRWEAPILRAVGSARWLRALCRPLMARGASADDILRYMSTDLAGNKHTFTWELADIRCPRGWLIARLRPWLSHEGLTAVEQAGTQLAAERAAVRRARMESVRAAQTAPRAVAPRPAWSRPVPRSGRARALAVAAGQ